ncbi:glycosyltransferase family 4 protein [Cohnella fermenti]|uniref:Glycosyltransferase family 4 protein n=1 Tax=Cohnella fermenti TaxID=2565925 RepID=A0A4S4BH03_9BACL|nr:glycosyltransferase family 4 protein [Cohnella fermenti]THF73662.1 glycosyltransferase family 4 protein [Cohnella fermenti]
MGSESIVYMSPKRSPHNKYSELLSESLERLGQRVEHYDRGAMRKPRRGDIVHFHWPSNSYTASSFPLTAVKSGFFLLLLLAYKLRGVRLYWTIHNVWPHAGKTRWDVFMRKRLLGLCDAAFALSESVRREAAAAFGANPDKIAVTPHGHYAGAYPAAGADIRERFGIPKDRFLFLFVGRINPYKGVEKLTEAYRAIDSGRCALLIAGQPDEGYGLGFLNAGDIKLYPDFVADEELADYLRAADAVVLPYRQISTSGSAILALSYMKPVIAPRLGALGEYVADGCGVLYDPDDPDGLRQALLGAMELDPARTEAAIGRKLMELDWDRIAGRMIRVYARRTLQEANGGNEANETNEVNA